ncbi:3,4-dihydroxy-2-butanone 4-phosphate synthase [Terfezia boudieri ATCC MYA-4762]|uniref:3,4-dihydroxy-2-butanone 4-phosphate synthase n=1 Tax=Terfezia boudieri ATCC MYA-4762 TaxID=1051890 RepID=A0A3N4LZU4_9PEZI|nr:3,4-dihydroxy-2-butanone 4-phosphate synthase [Terfezia boudieri ATCC MYA-4762]
MPTQQAKVPAQNGISKVKCVDMFDSIDDSIAAFARGEFLVVLDSADRENEGDLVIAAEDLTTEKMAWMVKVKHTSGLIVAPMSAPLLEHLALPQMVTDNQESHCTAFTISCDYAYNTTTGISAHDRALTCRKLADPLATAADFRRPGHMFPLRAVEGGVTARPGHTEAGVDFCKLAGKREVSAICELVRPDDRLMMRRDECVAFARTWGLKVCTIEALVEYLRKEKSAGGVEVE